MRRVLARIELKWLHDHVVFEIQKLSIAKSLHPSMKILRNMHKGHKFLLNITPFPCLTAVPFLTRIVGAVRQVAASVNSRMLHVPQGWGDFIYILFENIAAVCTTVQNLTSPTSTNVRLRQVDEHDGPCSILVLPLSRGSFRRLRSLRTPCCQRAFRIGLHLNSGSTGGYNLPVNISQFADMPETTFV